MKLLAIIALVVVLSPIALLVTCDYMENPKVEYASYAAAKSAGALGPGTWMPSWVPENATDITEQHNIDTNQTWLAFTFSGSIDIARSNCKVTSASANSSNAPRWWRKAYESLGSNRKAWSCTERTELEGYWAVAECLLVSNQFSAVYACGSSTLVPKQVGT